MEKNLISKNNKKSQMSLSDIRFPQINLKLPVFLLKINLSFLVE